MTTRSGRSTQLALGLVAGATAVLAALACAGSRSSRETPEVSATKEEGIAAFAVVKRVLQHPRCQNCHIPGDAPLQFDEGRPHLQFVVRGPKGEGAAGMSCATCHATQNPPDSYGPHMPPGAPNWHLPPPEQPMVFIHLSARDLAATLKDETKNGGKDLDEMLKHVSEDKLVLWGWEPGVGRAPVDVPHREFVAAFETWMAAGAPLPPE